MLSLYDNNQTYVVEAFSSTALPQDIMLPCGHLKENG